MQKLSDFIGKPVLSLQDGKIVGYIGNVWFDAKLTRSKTAEIFCDDDTDLQNMFVSIARLSCEGDAVVLSSLAHLLPQNQASATGRNPISRDAYNQSGKHLGKVRDILLDGNTVTNIVCGTGTFTPSNLLRTSDDCCVFNDTGAPLRIAKPRKRPSRQRPAVSASTVTPAPAATPTPMVAPMPNVAPAPEPPHPVPVAQPLPQPPTQPVPQEGSVGTPDKNATVTVTRTPGEAVKDYRFLLGKYVHSPVTQDGRILIPVGTVVSEQCIEIAREKGKLVQLALRAY